MNDDEREVFLRAKKSFDNYPLYGYHNVVKPLISAIDQLDVHHKEFARSLLFNHVRLLSDAIRNNSRFCEITSSMYDDSSQEIADTDSTIVDETAVTSVLRQLAREWSLDGKKERAISYGKIIFTLLRYYPEVSTRNKIKVMIPGCGLGRLPYELSLLGFNAVGNEFSSYMVLASQGILNFGFQLNELEIFPYIHSRSHWRTKNDQLRSIQIPDIALNVAQLGEMSMAVGDFFEMAFNNDNMHCFQAVVTSFFIDAPFNFFKTLDALTSIIEPGGLWINFGPLHWHSEMSGACEEETSSIELSLEDVLASVEQKGWTFLEHESSIQSTYCSTHPYRMGRMIFDCEFWVAKYSR